MKILVTGMNKNQVTEKLLFTTTIESSAFALFSLRLFKRHGS